MSYNDYIEEQARIHRAEEAERKHRRFSEPGTAPQPREVPETTEQPPTEQPLVEALVDEYAATVDRLQKMKRGYMADHPDYAKLQAKRHDLDTILRRCGR